MSEKVYTDLVCKAKCNRNQPTTTRLWWCIKYCNWQIVVGIQKETQF